MKFKAAVTSSRFDADAIVNKMADNVFAHQLESARTKVRDLKCPEHGIGVTVSINGAGSKRTLTVTGCCDAFRKQAMAVIQQK